MSSSSIPAHSGSHEETPSPPLLAGEKRTQPRVRRRNRLITSCLECRRRKLKCDKSHPCMNCTKNSRQCIFIAGGLDPEAQARLAEVKEKMGILERSLEDDVARKPHASTSATFATLKPSTLPGQEEFPSDQEEDDETKNLESSRLATEDAAYYEDDDNDDFLDLGIAMGKMRITERIGGLVRPKFSEELAEALKEVPKGEVPNGIALSHQNPDSWLAPSRDYVAPSSTFVFGPGAAKISLMNHLPAKILVDKLIAHYWIAVHPIAKAVHRPSFERQYERFWYNLNVGIEPRPSFQAIVFAALLSSIISMPETRVLTDFAADKQSLVDNFKEGTEAALARANFLRTTKLETLQAFAMYLIPLCRNEISRAHSALTGSLIRLAECMGLHRDPTTYSTSPVEIHVRRLVWYQICFLDFRTCEGTGPRPQIRPDDYDTKLPLNIDDIELERAENGEAIDVSTDRPYFTDMTITRIRFECYEMHRFLWHEQLKTKQKQVDGSKVTLTSLLGRIQSFQAAMEKTYLPMLSKSVPHHFLAAEIYGILSNRLYIMILQHYKSAGKSNLPERLRQIIMSTATMILEHSMTIEQQPELSTWSWYIGALHQYQVALLLINELYAGSREPAMEKRIWRCLDHTFELSPEMSYVDKVRLILEDLIGKTKIYADMKRVRAPTNMPQPGPRINAPGYKARQREAQEEKERSEAQTTANSTGTTSISPVPAPAPSQMHQTPLEQFPETQRFGSGVPNVNWGNIDLPGSLQNFQQIPPNYNFGAVPTTAPTGTQAFPASIPTPTTTTTTPPTNQYHSSSGSSPGAAMYGGMAAGGGEGAGAGTGAGAGAGAVGNTPMDALNEIDWNDIEKMFGSAEVGTGSMIIPPFTFPQFSGSNLQWSAQGRNPS